MTAAVDIVLLSYERTGHLERMVGALEVHTVHPYRLTVVDNASSPAHREWLRANAGRFDRIIYNARNEHLAAFQHGIAATASPLYVVSDADLLVHAPGADGCWLTRLCALAERHPGFGLISARLDTVTEARNAGVEGAPRVGEGGELIEADTGVWLNLVRRSALKVPYRSDGITRYAIRRAGFRVGIAADVYATHLGDGDAELHPDYLARKHAGTRLGVTYPAYTEVAQARRPPSPVELARAAPVLGALQALGIGAADVVELARDRFPPVRAVEVEVEAAVLGDGPAAASYTWRDEEEAPLEPAGAAAVVVAGLEADAELLALAQRLSARHVVLLTPDARPVLEPGWRIATERTGPDDRLLAWAQGGGRTLSRALGHSTVEQRDAWLVVWRAACFGAPRLRLYVLEREAPLPVAAQRWRPGARIPEAPAWRMPLPRRGRVAGPLTKATRLVQTEWDLLRARRGARA